MLRLMSVWLSLCASTGDALVAWLFLEKDASFGSHILTKNVMYVLVHAWNFVLLLFLSRAIFITQLVLCGSGIVCGCQYCCEGFN
jgi:hypothetical protein